MPHKFHLYLIFNEVVNGAPLAINCKMHNLISFYSVLNALLGDVVNGKAGLARGLKHTSLIAAANSISGTKTGNSISGTKTGNSISGTEKKAPMRVNHRLAQLYSFTRCVKF